MIQTHKINGKIYITNGERPKMNDTYYDVERNDVFTRFYYDDNVYRDDLKVILTNDTLFSDTQQLTAQEVELIESGVEFEVEEYNTFGVDNWKYKLISKQQSFDNHTKKELYSKEDMEQAFLDGMFYSL